MQGVAASIFDHHEWPLLRGYLYIRRGHDGVNGARHRIEVSHAAPLQVFEMRVACAHCGKEITPVRIDARGAWTFNASCPLSVNVKCARMPETTEVCSRVRAVINGRPLRMGSLFDDETDNRI